jgi:toxin ParE1/3/4
VSRGYQLTPQAKADIIEIWQYTLESWGKAQAKKYLGQIEQDIQRLLAGSIVGRPCNRLTAKSGSQLRYWRSGKHYIIHRLAVDESLQVLTLLHGASHERLEGFLESNSED